MRSIGPKSRNQEANLAPTSNPITPNYRCRPRRRRPRAIGNFPGRRCRAGNRDGVGQPAQAPMNHRLAAYLPNREFDPDLDGYTRTDSSPGALPRAGPCGPCRRGHECQDSASRAGGAGTQAGANAFLKASQYPNNSYIGHSRSLSRRSSPFSTFRLFV